MQNRLDRITIKGFKSIENLEDFKLNNLNVLIGGNGSGKSNFIDFFRMLRTAMGQEIPGIGNNLELFIEMGGGIDSFLFKGPKNSDEIESTLVAGKKSETFSLKAGHHQGVVASASPAIAAALGSSGLGSAVAATGAVVGGAMAGAIVGGALAAVLGGISSAAFNSVVDSVAEIKKEKSRLTRTQANQNYNHISGGTLCDTTNPCINAAEVAPYHFHDTSKTSKMRRSEIIQDNESLRLDAANIAPFLLRLHDEFPDAYEDILETIQTVTPFFDEFTLKIRKQGERESINLEWKQQGSDYPMQPYHLSDGTLRFICLATALLQPCPPGIIIIDEPELGLHPFALGILAELIQSASTRSQIIIATQSTELVNYFSPEDVVVVNRKGGASTFNRLDSDDLGLWLEDYSLGQLWQKNVIAGGPDYE